jgi:hypothetical protein
VNFSSHPPGAGGGARDDDIVTTLSASVLCSVEKEAADDRSTSDTGEEVGRKKGRLNLVAIRVQTSAATRGVRGDY